MTNSISHISNSRKSIDKDRFLEQVLTILYSKKTRNSELREALLKVINNNVAQQLQLDIQKAVNEELLQANDELGALYADIHLSIIALNDKYQKVRQKCCDLTQLSFLANLAALVVDRQYKIRRCTENISRIIPIGMESIGQSISILNYELRFNDIKQHIKKVYETLKKKRIKKVSRNGHNYVVHIAPLVDRHNSVKEIIVGIRKECMVNVVDY